MFRTELTALTGPAVGSVPLLPKPTLVFAEKVKEALSVANGLGLSRVRPAFEDKAPGRKAVTCTVVL